MKSDPGRRATTCLPRSGRQRCKKGFFGGGSTLSPLGRKTFYSTKGSEHGKGTSEPALGRRAGHPRSAEALPGAVARGQVGPARASPGVRQGPGNPGRRRLRGGEGGAGRSQGGRPVLRRDGTRHTHQRRGRARGRHHLAEAITGGLAFTT